jgi:small conductance mechanosensitive channel
MLIQFKELIDFFIRLFIITAGGFLAYLAGKKAIYHVHFAQKDGRQQAKTALIVLKNIWKYVVFVVVLLMALTSFPGVAIPAVVITAVIASTIGFGAQSFMKDIIAGFSIIFEGQFIVGDNVHLQGLDIDGIVKEIGLRATLIEDAQGNAWYVPNGEIKAVKKIKKS